MNQARKLVSTLLIAVLWVTSVQGVFGAAPASKTDIRGTWAESQISDWVGKGYVTGYEDGTFKPNNTISRAEFVTLINRSYGFTEQAAVPFRDISPSSWIYAEVAKALKAGYIKGYSDGTFGATRSISRQEAAVIVDRLLSLENANQEAGFTDSNAISSWAKSAVDAAVANGIIRGYSNGSDFKPHQPLTRAEAVVVLYRSVTVKETLAGAPNPTPPTPTLPTPIPTPTTPVPVITPIPTPTTTPNPNPNPTTPTTPPVDRTAPTLSGVTAGQVSFGDHVGAISNEKGQIYLVPSTTGSTLAELNQAVSVSLGTKLSVEAGVSANLQTAGLDLGRYVAYAVDASGNVSAASGEIVITEKQLMIAAPAALKTIKMYDGTSSTSVTAGALIHVVGDDSVTVQAAASYDDSAVGTGKTITVVYTLSGADADHYGAPANDTVSTGVIDPAQLTIEAPVLSVEESLAGDSELKALSGSLIGVVAGEQVTVSVEATYDPGTSDYARPVTLHYTLAGADAAHYKAPADNMDYLAYVQNHEDTGRIIDLITTAKVYDGTLSSAVLAGSRSGSCTGAGICDGDDAKVEGQGAYDNKNVGTGKTIYVTYTVVGADAPNYLKPDPVSVTTGGITARPLTVTPPVLTPKVYDGNTTAVVTAGTLINTISGDEVFVHAAATYNNPQAGTGKQVTIVYTLSGSDAGNYLAPASLTVDTGEITSGL